MLLKEDGLERYILSAQRRTISPLSDTSEISIQELLMALTLVSTSFDSEILAWNIHFPVTCSQNTIQMVEKHIDFFFFF